MGGCADVGGGIETGSDPDFFGKFPEIVFEHWEGVLGIWLMVLRGDGESAKMRKMSEFREMGFPGGGPRGPRGPKGAHGGPWGPMGTLWGPRASLRPLRALSALKGPMGTP